MRKRAFTVYSTSRFNHCHAVTFVSDGAYYAVWAQGDETEESVTNRIVGAKSTDGRHWGVPTRIAGVEGANNLNPALLQGRDRTWLFWNDITHQMTFSRYSDDSGNTWSAPEARSEMREFWGLRANGIVLKSGRLLLPCYSQHGGSAVLWSDDRGNCWHLGSPVSGRGLSEPTVVERADGTLLMYMRKEPTGPLCESVSQDSGETWAPAVQIPGIVSPSAPAFLYRTGSGRLIFIYNNSPRSRSPLVYRWSLNDGCTWSRSVTVDKAEGEQNFVDYASCVEGANSELLIVYARQYWRGGRLLGFLLGRKLETKALVVRESQYT